MNFDFDEKRIIDLEDLFIEALKKREYKETIFKDNKPLFTIIFDCRDISNIKFCFNKDNQYIEEKKYYNFTSLYFCFLDFLILSKCIDNKNLEEKIKETFDNVDYDKLVTSNKVINFLDRELKNIKDFKIILANIQSANLLTLTSNPNKDQIDISNYLDNVYNMLDNKILEEYTNLEKSLNLILELMYKCEEKNII